jgi:hypothetical protein
MSLLDLFRPKWKHPNWHVRLAAVDQLTDEALLADIAENDTAPEVRRSAAERAQALWAHCAKTTVSELVRELALEKLTDQVLLGQIAASNMATDLRAAALAKLSDQHLAAEIVENSDAVLGIAAVKRITDQSLLAEIARTAPGIDVRVKAVAKLTDLVVLARIAETDPARVTVYEVSYDMRNDYYARDLEPPPDVYKWPVREAAENRLKMLRAWPESR